MPYITSYIILDRNKMSTAVLRDPHPLLSPVSEDPAPREQR